MVARRKFAEAIHQRAGGADGFLYVTGYTTSSDFPVTPNAFQPSPGGGVDNFLLKINLSNYSIAYATYVAGNGYDEGRTVTATATGVASVGGRTHSTNLPLLNPLQSQLLGPSDGFITVIDTISGNLRHSTYLGTTQTSDSESVFSLTTDPAGRLWAAGWATGSGLPTTANAWQSAYAGNTDGFLIGYSDPIAISVTVSPAVVSLYGGQTQQFAAAVAGSANTAVSWTSTGGGTVNTSGFYTAPSSVAVLANVVVTATAVADTTKTATAAITLYPPVSVTVSTAAATLYGGQTRQYTAIVANTANTAVTWTVTGGGSIGPTGIYSAPAIITALATATVRATSVADPTKSATATVTLYPPLIVMVSPATASLPPATT